MLRSQVVFRSLPVLQVGPALAAVLLWGALAAGVAYWVLHLPAPTTAVLPAVSAGAPVPTPDTGPMARALGHIQAQAAVSADSNRYQLLGVIASVSGQGSALIAIDGQPPKAWRVGQAVQEGVYLQKLAPRQAWLGQTLTGPAQWTLNMAGSGTNP